MSDTQELLHDYEKVEEGRECREKNQRSKSFVYLTLSISINAGLAIFIFLILLSHQNLRCMDRCQQIYCMVRFP